MVQDGPQAALANEGWVNDERRLDVPQHGFLVGLLLSQAEQVAEHPLQDLPFADWSKLRIGQVLAGQLADFLSRSEERRVGKECRSRCWPYHYKKKTSDQSAIVSITV